MASKPLRNSFNPAPSQQEVDTFVNAAGAGANEIIVEFLDKYTAAIDAPGSDGQVALANAVVNGQVDTVELLLNKGADTEAKTYTAEHITLGRTALLWAVEVSNIYLIDMLLSRGANIEAQDNEHWTPLMYAAQKGNRDLAMLLLEKGATVYKKKGSGDIKNENGQTDMEWAEANDNQIVMTLLREDREKDNRGLTAPMLARAGNHEEALALLEQWGDRQEQAAIHAAVAAQQRRLKELARDRALKITPKQ